MPRVTSSSASAEPGAVRTIRAPCGGAEGVPRIRVKGHSPGHCPPSPTSTFRSDRGLGRADPSETWSGPGSADVERQQVLLGLAADDDPGDAVAHLSLIHISEPTRL